jgi:hypothetical protein
VPEHLKHSGVILDGVCPPDHTYIIFYDEDLNSVGIDFIYRCVDSLVCIKHLGISPVQTLAELYQQIEDETLPCLERILSVYQSRFYWRLNEILLEIVSQHCSRLFQEPATVLRYNVQ